MDLTDLWQQHKKFILVVAGSLLLLVVGKGVLNSQYPVGDRAKSTSSINLSLAKSPQVEDKLVRSVSDEVNQLKERLLGLVTEMNFTPEPLFVLDPASSNPRADYFEIVHRLQELLVDTAERRDILVPEKLGFQELAPTDIEEIRRSLFALNIIQNVLLSSIDAGVRRVARITIEDEQKTRSKGVTFVQELGVEFEIVGNEASLRRVIADLVDGPKSRAGSFLEVTKPTRIEPLKGEKDMLLLRLSVSGLTISTDGQDLETS